MERFLRSLRVVTGCTPPPYADISRCGLYLVAGSGGPSSCINPTGTFPNVTCSGNYSKPSWQSGAGVPNDIARDIPDVSLFAGNGLNYSFYVICEMDANASAGGSSTSCDLNAPYTGLSRRLGNLGVGASVRRHHGAGEPALRPPGQCELRPVPDGGQERCKLQFQHGARNEFELYLLRRDGGEQLGDLPGGSPNCSNTSTASGQYGIMVSGRASAAYATTTGYDLATGLGSVNVANLVNNWTSNFTPSTTTLSLSTNPATNPITLTHGQPINFTINVAPGPAAARPRAMFHSSRKPAAAQAMLPASAPLR